ncbi:myosin-1, partial [Biomphalaria glabrata]
MSTYHYAVKKLIAEVDKFLNVTLKSENLSKQAFKEKDKIIELIQKLYGDYTSLAPSGDEGSTSSARDTGGNNSL